jgi:hypothetical protein
MARGRVRRKQLAAVPAPASPPTVCALCRRVLGRKIEWHHVVPRSHGGIETAPLHPICHRAVHATLSNAEIARLFPTLDRLREQEQIARFLSWIADKPPDFHAPTRRTKPR